MQRFCLYARLKSDKVDEYATLHRNCWEEIRRIIKECNITHYSISLRGEDVYTYYEYVGEDYDADMKKMESYPIMWEWWSHTRPCFVGHEEGKYYEDMSEVFFLE